MDSTDVEINFVPEILQKLVAIIGLLHIHIHASYVLSLRIIIRASVATVNGHHLLFEMILMILVQTNVYVFMIASWHGNEYLIY